VLQAISLREAEQAVQKYGAVSIAGENRAQCQEVNLMAGFAGQQIGRQEEQNKKSWFLANEPRLYLSAC
jgi:hypothetical protein